VSVMLKLRSSTLAYPLQWRREEVVPSVRPGALTLQQYTQKSDLHPGLEESIWSFASGTPIGS